VLPKRADVLSQRAAELAVDRLGRGRIPCRACATRVPPVCRACAGRVPPVCRRVRGVCRLCATCEPGVCHRCATGVPLVCGACAGRVPGVCNCVPWCAACVPPVCRVRAACAIFRSAAIQAHSRSAGQLWRADKSQEPTHTANHQADQQTSREPKHTGECRCTVGHWSPAKRYCRILDGSLTRGQATDGGTCCGMSDYTASLVSVSACFLAASLKFWPRAHPMLQHCLKTPHEKALPCKGLNIKTNN